MFSKNGCSSLVSQQRKLLALVLVWTSALSLILIFKWNLFSQNQPISSSSIDSSLNRVTVEYLVPLRQPKGTISIDGDKQKLDDEQLRAGTLPVSLRAASSSERPPTQATASPTTTTTSESPNMAAAPQRGQCNFNYPSLLDLKFNNIYWQKLTTATHSGQNVSNYYLYNAYYDDRWRAGEPSVRVLAMIDRIRPPKTDCLLWSSKLRNPAGAMVPLVARASFVYAWYPRWGNYKDGLLQPWIVTCPVVGSRGKQLIVPDSVSLVPAPAELLVAQTDELGGVELEEFEDANRWPREAAELASIPMPASFSSSSSSSSWSSSLLDDGNTRDHTSSKSEPAARRYDCSETVPITNNLPVFNRRPKVKQRFAVCVKGLDFPHEDVSVRLIEWIELLNVLGASKIFLYKLNVHENVSRVLHYYQKRGLIELNELTLPGEQPNEPEYQHQFMKSRLTTKRQNELIPYNDCLYRNLHSFDYLALLDIDEIIMPLKHHDWHALMQQVERESLGEQNYSRASYNARNVYFFDDLAGPLGTASSLSNANKQLETQDTDARGQQLESGIPHYLHMMQHVYRSKNYTKPGQYVKCFHNTERVVSLHNHFPMNCFGQCTTYSIPVELAHLQHYRRDCVGPLKQACKSDFRAYTQRDTTIWKYKQQMIRRTTRVLNKLGFGGS